MAENPTSSPLQPPIGGDQTPQQQQQQQQQQPNPSPQISAPHSLQQSQQQQQAAAYNITDQSNNLQRSGSAPRLNQLQQQLTATAAANALRQFAGTGASGQLSFGGGGVSQIRPSQIPMLPSLPRQKTGSVQNVQLGNGMQGMGTMNSMGMRGNGTLISYAQQQQQQQRFNSQVQMRRQQQLLPQMPQTLPQKLSGPSLSRSSSLASMNPQLSGLSPNSQSALMQSTLAQQQWLKQMQPTMAASVSPSYSLQQQQQQRQQQAFLSSQLSSSLLHQKSLGLSQQQISQLLQHQSRMLSPQQHLQQLQQFQQFQQQQQQQQYPGITGTAVHQSLSLTGSQPGAPESGATTTGGSSGTETGSQLLGKRKIQDLVSQVDSLGKLDPEVEDLLLDLADDFIDSVTTFACSLAKHRKSSTLDSKDLLLHLEKNWHLKIPGCTREEQMNQGISLSTDAHTRRLEAVRALMDSQQLERVNSSAKGTVKQNINSSIVEHPIKPPPSSEHVALPATSSQMMHQIPRF